MNSKIAESSSSRKVEPVYLVMGGAIVIEAPLQRTWLQMVDYPSWQTFDICQHISGPVGQEGEVVRLSKDEPGFSFPPYYARTIKIVPEQRIIWKTYPEKGQEVDFFGIVDFMVQDDSRKTRLTYGVLYEFQVPHSDAAELEAFQKAQYENFGNLISP